MVRTVASVLLILACLAPCAFSQAPAPDPGALLAAPEQRKDLPAHALARLGSERFRGPSHLVGYAANGKLLVTSSTTEGVCVWDADSGRERHRFAYSVGEDRGVRSRTKALLSPDGKTIATDDGSAVKLWEVHTGKLLGELLGEPEPNKDFGRYELTRRSLAFAPDGRSLAVTSENVEMPNGDPRSLMIGSTNPHGDVLVFDLSTMKQMDSIRDRGGVLAFTPDGKSLISSRRVLTGQTTSKIERSVIEFATGKLRPPDETCQGFWSPDGSSRLRFEEKMGKPFVDTFLLRVFDGASARQRFEFEVVVAPEGLVGFAFPSAAISPDSRSLAVINDRRIILLNLQDGAVVREFEPTLRYLSGLSFSPDGKTLAAGGSYRAHGDLSLWDVRTGKEIGHRGHYYPIHELVFSPDGRRLATSPGDEQATSYGRRDHVRVWDTTTGDELALLGEPDTRHPRSPRALAFSADGSKLLLQEVCHQPKNPKGPSPLHHWSVAESKRLGSFAQYHMTAQWGFPSPGWHLMGVAANSTRAFAWYFDDKTIRVCDADSGKEERSWPAPFQVWRLLPEKNENLPQGSLLDSLLVAGDGKTWAWTCGASVHVLEAERELKTFKVEQFVSEGEVTINERLRLAFTPDARFLVVAGKKLHVWDLADGKPVEKQVVERPGWKYGAFQIAANGKLLAFSAHPSVCLVDLETGKDRALLKEYSAWGIALSADARLLAVVVPPDGKKPGEPARDIAVIDTATGKELARLKGHTRWVRCLAFSPKGDRLASGGDDCQAYIWDMTALDK